MALFYVASAMRILMVENNRNLATKNDSYDKASDICGVSDNRDAGRDDLM